MSNLIDELKKDEGLRLQAYQDHLGVWTIGYGTNLQTLSISEEQATEWLYDYVADIQNRLMMNNVYLGLSQERQDVIASMVYQMGYNGTMNFKNMWRALERADYQTAADEMRDSKWWRDPKTRARAERMAVRMETGIWLV